MSSPISHPHEEHLVPPEHKEDGEEHHVPSLQDETGEEHYNLYQTPEFAPQSLKDAVPAVSDTNGFTNDTQADFAIIKEEDSDSEFLWAKMQEHTIELASSTSDSDNESIAQDVEKELIQLPVTFNDDGDRVVEILDSDGEGLVLPIKQEPAALSFDWSKMHSEPIVLSDCEDDAAVVIKQEPGDVEFLWAQKGDSGVIDLLDSEEDMNQEQTRSAPVLSSSLLQRSNPRDRERRTVDVGRMRELQQIYAARAMESRQRTSTGASRIFNVPKPPYEGSETRDVNAWMRCAPKDTRDSTSNFAEIKRQYRARKKARTATIQDEILFKKAQDSERARIRKLEARISRMDSSDEDEAEQSDHGLFIPDSTPPFLPLPKRPNNGDEGDDGDDEREKPRGSKRQKNSAKPVRSKTELRNELYYNLMAGYEEEAAKDQKKEEYKAMDADKAAKRKDREKRKKKSKNPNSKHTHELMKGKKPGRSKAKPITKSKRKPMTVRNLKTANIFKESNANLAKLSMPAMSGKAKRKAMIDLIASIPLEESKLAQATTDKASILKATIMLGNCKVNENRAEGEGDWNLKGITTPLYHHQVQGAARMKERECGESPPQGGILADEMGHGKTLSTIVAMISNPPAPAEEQCCTLIVCTPSLLSQWDEEIEKHTKPGILGEILRHHRYTRVSSKGASGRGAIKMMETTGVVLSTYSEVLASYPKCDIPEHLTTPVEKMTWWKNVWETERGILHRVQFYRVILDESQAIKNHRSSTSIACRALMAKHRWAVSGTPIQNSIEEIYPYFKFLRIPYTGSFRIFKHNFCDPENEACAKRLHSILDQMMIRRTHQDEILGTAILKLPKAHQETKYITFNEVEGKIYMKIRRKFIKILNVALADANRTEEDRRRIILTMVLRLRQMTSHLFLLQAEIEGMFDVEDIDNYSSDLSEDSPMKSNCLHMLKALRMMIEAKDDECSYEKTAQKTTKGKDEPEMIFNFRKLLRTLKDSHKWAELRDRSNCYRCKLPAEDPMLTSCSHLYCSECLRAMSYEASELDQDHSKCLKCDEAFTECTPCVGLKELEPINLSSPSQKVKRPQGLLSESLPERPRRTVNDTMKWVIMDDKVVPSTKTNAVTEQLEQWLESFPTQKIIIFSQFHLVFQILGKVCEEKKWKYCHYNGKMSHKAREEAVEKFRDDKDMNIMIASLKCGGIGLNLTMASRVICVDLWFNSSVEQQAFCRVLRIGQKLETHIARFIVKGTIDERLIHLQNYKDQIIGAAMDDRTVLAKLEFKELLNLFGEVGLDANSQPFIYAEDNTENLWGPLKESGVVVEDNEGPKEKQVVVEDDEGPEEDDPVEEET